MATIDKVKLEGLSNELLAHFGPAYTNELESRCSTVMNFGENNQKENILKNERVNETNFNEFADQVNVFVKNLAEAAGFAVKVSNRDVQMTKEESMEKSEGLDTSGIIQM